MGRGLSRVLIIGEEVGTREALAECISSFELAVTTARDGREGIEQALRGKPDAILVDLRSLGQGGEAFLAALQRDPALADIPVVALGATPARLPVKAALVKPFDLDELAKLLRRLGSGERLVPQLA